MFVNKLCTEERPDIGLIEVAVSEVERLSDSSTQQDLKNRLSGLLNKIRDNVSRMQESLPQVALATGESALRGDENV